MDELSGEGPAASVEESPAGTVLDDDLMLQLVDSPAGSQLKFDGMSGSYDEKEGLGNDMESFGNVGVVEGDAGSKAMGESEGQFCDGRAETGVKDIQDVSNGIDARGEGAEVVDGEDQVPAEDATDTGDMDSSVWNPGIDGGAGVLSVTTRKEENCVDKEGLTLKDEVSGEDVAVDALTDSVKDQCADVEIVDEPCDGDNVHHASVKSLDNPTEAVHGSHVVLVRTKESLPTGNLVMETNVDDQCSQSPEKFEPVKDDQAADGNGSHGNSSPDTQSPSEVPDQIEKTEIVEGHLSTEIIEDSGVESETQVPETETVEQHPSTEEFEESGLDSETQVSDVRNDAKPTEGSPIVKQDGDAAPDSVLESETRVSDVRNDATPTEKNLIVKPDGDNLAAPELSLMQSSFGSETQVPETETVEVHLSTGELEESGLESETQVSDIRNDGTPTEGFPIVKQDGGIIAAPESGLESETQVSDVRNDATHTENFPIMKPNGDNPAALELSLVQSSVESKTQVPEIETVEVHRVTGKFEESGLEPDTQLSDVRNDATPTEGFPTVKQDGDIIASPESGLKSETQVSDVRNDAVPTEKFSIVKPDGDNLAAPESSRVQSSVEDTGEWAAVDIDEVIDFKDEGIVLDAPHSGVETSVNDFVGGEGHPESGLPFVEGHVGFPLKNAEVAAQEKAANLRGEVPEGNAPGERNEPSYTLDIPETTEKKIFMEANTPSSSEPNVAVVATELATESQVIAPVSNPVDKQSQVLEENDNRVVKGVTGHTEDSLLGNNSAEVSVGIDNRADFDVLLQNDCAEIKSTGDGEDVAAGEQHPDDKQAEKQNDWHQSSGYDAMQVDIPEFKSNGDEEDVAVGEQYRDDRQGDQGKEDVSTEENVSEIEEKSANPHSSVCIEQPRYLVGPENGGEFSSTDLVWGKIRNHPWWPGQIFDPADASDKAVKHYKKDCFLVAYFGDQTFAWNDASLLKPFRQNFSQIEKQSSSEAFQNAVNCALDEVSRRVMLGLSCPCISREARERIECQVVENTGIREESSRRFGVDRSTEATSFQPDKLLQYVEQLAQSPQRSPNRLELVLAEAQVSALCRFKGYREPPRFDSRDANFAGVETLRPSDFVDQPTPNDDVQKDSLQSRKERRLSELMDDGECALDDENEEDGKALRKVSAPSGKKRKAMDSLNDGSDRRTSFYAAKVSTTSSSPKVSFKVPKITFKVGDCIRRVASQLTGSAPGSKSANEQTGAEDSRPMGDNSSQGVTEFSSVEEILSQLQLAAREPKKGYNFLRNITVFFSGFRNSVVKKHTAAVKSGGGRKRKAEHSAAGATEDFEFDDVNDSYWRDRVVQNQPEDQVLEMRENGAKDQQLVYEPISFRRGRGNFSRKRYSYGNQEVSLEEQRRSAEIDRKRLELPAELVLTFTDGDGLPSDNKLNRMFKRFGPLKESETEIDFSSHRARVVFKRGADAQAAYSSVGIINIFGSIAVSYQLNYSPSSSFSSLPVLMLEGRQEAT